MTHRFLSRKPLLEEAFFLRPSSFFVPNVTVWYRIVAIVQSDKFVIDYSNQKQQGHQHVSLLRLNFISFDFVDELSYRV